MLKGSPSVSQEKKFGNRDLIFVKRKWWKSRKLLESSWQTPKDFRRQTRDVAVHVWRWDPMIKKNM